MNFKFKLTFAIFFILLILTSISVSAGSHLKLSSELKQKVETASSSDSIDVIIMLKEPQIQKPEEKSSLFKISQDDVISTEKISQNIKRRYALINAISASLTKDEIEKLEKNDEVEKIYYPKSFSIALQDSVPQINADDVWIKQLNSVNITGAGQAVCVLDTGINASHSAFSGRIIAQHCYESLAPYCPNGQPEDTNASDDHGHGTHVAGIAAASGAINGIAKVANIIAIKIMNKTGSGTSPDLISALEWCINNASLYNITAISMSLGTSTLFSAYCDSEDPTTTNLLNQAVAKNITVLIAAGNNGNSTAISWPACIENATAVGAVNKSDSIVDSVYPNGFNRWNKTNFVLAPGFRINSTWITGGYYVDSGTSMATPHVAGVVALLQQYSMQKNNRLLTPAEVRNALRSSGVNISDSSNNLSRIDVLAAIRSLSFYKILNQSDQNALIQTNENASFNFTNINNNADLWVEKISNKNFWIITSNLTAKSFNSTIKFLYSNSYLSSSLFYNSAVMRWANSTASGTIAASINRSESSATIQTDHFTDFSLDSLIKVNGTNLAPVATKCSTILGIISFNISNKAQNDNVTQIIVSSKNTNDSSVSVILCSDDGDSSFSPATDCNSTLKLNETTFSSGNITFSNIISVANNTEKFIYIAYNVSACQNNDIFDAMIPDSGITMQIAGSSIGAIDPSGNSTSDSSAPYYTSINNTNYTYSPSYLFYSTWLDNSQVQAAWLEINQTGNFTASKSGNLFTSNVTNLAAGNYIYRWWANDSVANINQSEWFMSIVSKAISSVNLTINGSDSDLSIEINNVINKSASIIVPSSGLIILYENGTLAANGTSQISNTSNYTTSGTFNITAVYPETQNYSSSSHTHSIKVEETTTPPVSYKISPLNNNFSNNLIQNFQINASDASLKNSTLYIYSSGSQIHTNNTLISGNTANINWTYTFSGDGAYTWGSRVCDASHNCNWSDGNNWTLTLDTVKPVINLSLSASSITTAQSITVQCNVSDSNLNSITIDISGSITTCSSSPCTYSSYSSSSSGTKTVNCSAQDKAGNLNSTSATFTVTTASSGQGSTGPGSGAPPQETQNQTQPAPLAQLPQIVDSRNINVIVGGTNYSMLINKETTISQVNIYAKNTISNSQFTIKKLTAKPESVSLPKNTVYSYIEIITDIVDADINNATIIFEIPKSWLNNVNLDSVSLQRYYDSQWQSLQTKQTGETDLYYSFSAISPGFSVFAITALKEIVFGIAGSCGDGKCTGNETKVNCCKDCGCEGNLICSNNKCITEQQQATTIVIWLLAAIFLAVIIRITAAIWPNISEKLKNHQKHKKFHPKK